MLVVFEGGMYHSHNNATLDNMHWASQSSYIPHKFFTEVVRKDILKGKQREERYLNQDHP